jgi:hypothetical protein
MSSTQNIKGAIRIPSTKFKRGDRVIIRVPGKKWRTGTVLTGMYSNVRSTACLSVQVDGLIHRQTINERFLHRV